MEAKDNSPQAQGRTLLRLCISAADRGDDERALRYVRGSLALDPDSVAAALWERALQGEKPAACLADLAKALEQDPAATGLVELEAWLAERIAGSRGKLRLSGLKAPWRHLMHSSPDEADVALPRDEDARVSVSAAMPADDDELPDLDGAHDAELMPTEPDDGSDISQPVAGPAGQGLRAIGTIIMVLMLTYILLGTAIVVAGASSDVWQECIQGWIAGGDLGALEIITPVPSVTATRLPTATLLPSSTPTLTPTAAPTSTPTMTPTPEWVTDVYSPLPLDEKWIEVDLSDQMLYAFEGTDCVFESLVSTGKDGTPTRRGRFRIQTKYLSQDMGGPGYYLPNVQFVQYFYINFAIHSAYWHDSWGTPTSHGCVNMVTEDAEWLFNWTTPVFSEGASIVSATSEELGTWVLVHE